MSTHPAPVLFLMGATACGKTALSLSLAEALDAEIISVDSALVYRTLNIGTAKPSADELARVRHHLIDICDPWEVYSAARFCADACQAIDDIRSRGKQVLMVGGTMLYFKALEEGLAPLPDADPQVRATLMREAEDRGWPAMHAQLQSIDPGAAARIHPNDPQRVQRALEVFRITGVPLSKLQADTQSPLDQPPLKFALVPEDRHWLHQRIERRLHMMVDGGFLDEVRSLRRHPQINASLPAMRSVGYRQAWEYLDTLSGEQNDHSSQLDAVWLDKAVAATRQLAKRQLTWLRGMQEVHKLSCDTLPVATQEQRILNTLRTLSGAS